MTRTKIIEAIKSLASSQGFYSRLYFKITDGSEESEEYLDHLETLELKDSVDLVLYLEQ